MGLAPVIDAEVSCQLDIWYRPNQWAMDSKAVTRDHVIVIGAGIGGVTCAIDLARSGFAVTVIERAERCGGKMREVQVGTSVIDAGPTVLTMRWVFEKIFEDAGASLSAVLALRPLGVLARHAWSGAGRLDLFADKDQSADAIGRFAGKAEAAGYLAFCVESRRIYETLRDSFLTAQQEGPLGLARKVGFGRANDLLALRPFETLWQALGGHFRDQRLRQLFGRYATYCGSSPFAAPATLMLVAHVEQEGVWIVEGGMQRLAEALRTLALSLGVTFRFSTDVQRIALTHGRVSGVSLDTGEQLRADCVVVNADSAAITAGAFGADVVEAIPPRPPSTRSLSAVTWALTARTAGAGLVRHNVFFSEDYASEFKDIFNRGRMPLTPTIYVCAQDRDDDDSWGAGAERLLILINAPATGGQGAFDEEELSACRARVWDHLKRCGLTLSYDGRESVVATPDRFNAMFPATGGALYGQATHGWSAAFQRPGARTRAPGLYLAGGGAHPGAGVPMAALSGRLAAAQILKDRTSARPFRPVAMLGGM